MANISAIPVDHEPDFGDRWSAIPVEHDPFVTADSMATRARYALADNMAKMPPQQPTRSGYGSILDWSNVGAAMPESYGRDEEIMDPLANAVLATGKALTYPGRALQSQQPITTEQMIKPAAEIAGLTTLGAGAIPAEANALRAGIRAYHGSPHDFDKFSLAKIGTGEGAQAYGHGLYFAGNEAVAKSYKAAGPASNAQYDAINQRLSQLAKEMDANSSGYRNFKDKALGSQQAAEYDALMDKKSNLGNMYEVDINAHPDHFLDWDKPLSQQHPVVQDALKSTMGTNWDQFKHADAGTAVKNGFIAPSAEGTAGKLSGIPGIKYLDQGSRGVSLESLQSRLAEEETGLARLSPHYEADHPLLDNYRQSIADLKQQIAEHKPPTSNYVVFDDKLVDILRKYGLAGLPASGFAAHAAVNGLSGDQRQ